MMVVVVAAVIDAKWTQLTGLRSGEGRLNGHIIRPARGTKQTGGGKFVGQNRVCLSASVVEM